MPRAEVGVFGGSGFYSFLEDVEEVVVRGSRVGVGAAARTMLSLPSA